MRLQPHFSAPFFLLRLLCRSEPHPLPHNKSERFTAFLSFYFVILHNIQLSLIIKIGAFVWKAHTPPPEYGISPFVRYRGGCPGRPEKKENTLRQPCLLFSVTCKGISYSNSPMILPFWMICFSAFFRKFLFMELALMFISQSKE